MAEVASGDGAMAFKLFGTTIRVEKPVAKEAEEPKESCVKEGEMMAVEGLVCPRCKSTDTKFCYFNNYNVNQPRHFCRACHRYWTAGGALRDVPIGAGRRRSRPLPRPAARYPVPCMSTMVMGYWLQDPPAKRPCSGFNSRFSC